MSLLGVMRVCRRAAIIQMKPHSLACSSPPAVDVCFLINQGLVLVLTTVLVLWTPALNPIVGHCVRKTTLLLPSF